MRIRRPLAALVVGLAMVGGGTLSACDVSPQDANRGLPNDSIPSSATSSGLLPHNSNQIPNDQPENAGGGNTEGRP